MNDIFFVISLIFGFTIILALVRRYNYDACLKDFSGDQVRIRFMEGEPIEGRMHVEASGLEIGFPPNEQMAVTSLLYSHEYKRILALIREIGNLSASELDKRQRGMNAIYHPSLFRRVQRQITILFKMARDGLMDIVGLLIGLARTHQPIGNALKGDGGRTEKLGQEVIGFFGTAYEPLIERYIGKYVVVTVHEGGQQYPLRGILKNYSSTFLQLMNVEAPWLEGEADLIIRREVGILRHLSARESE